jgi:hypothetical protein
MIRPGAPVTAANGAGGVLLYCGLNETAWNHHPVPSFRRFMIAPVYGKSEKTRTNNSVRVPDEPEEIIQDSGAFVDSWDQRLTFLAALKRQDDHAERYRYADRIAWRVSYDLLIDEVWVDGNRTKRRWSVGQAESAVEQTVAAAKFLSEHRNGIPLILAAQGVDAAQYLGCVEKIVPLMRAGDTLGLGGWCIVGKRPYEMMPVFHETVDRVIPFAAKEGVKRIHIFGVCFAPALGYLLWHCAQHGIEVSTDSAGPSTRPTRKTDNWGYAEWIDRHYTRHPVETRGLERARHVDAVSAWLADFRSTVHFTPERIVDFKMGRQIPAKARVLTLPTERYEQLPMFQAVAA